MNKRIQRLPAVFRSAAQYYHADTCDPLKAAAACGAVRLAALGCRSYPGQRLPARDLREVCSVGCWDADHQQDWGLDWHRNEGIELTYLAAGLLPFAVDNRAYKLEPGDFTITRPWQRHRVGAPRVTASRLIWLILDVGVRRPNQLWHWPPWLLLSSAMRQNLTRQLRHNEQPVWRADRELRRCFEALGTAVADPLTSARLTRFKLYINELLVALAELFARRPPRLNAHLSSAERTERLFLDELPQRIEEPWTLETMSAQCGLGRSHFSHYCQQLTNSTPIEYLTRCRLDNAARRLRAYPEQSITDIAFVCGFQSSQYFSTVFTRHFSRTPRAWRSERRNKSQRPR